MKKYLHTCGALVVIIFLSFSWPVQTSAQRGKTLDLRFHRQHTQVWCWGASIAMVVEYLKGGRIEDCEVLSIYDRSLGGRGLCCQGAPECVRGAMPGEIAGILGNIFGVRGQVLDRGLSWSEVVSNIDNDLPVIAWIWNSPTSAHVVVIVGYTQSRELVIFDPLTGPKTVSFDGFATNWGPGHNWNITWIFSSEVAETRRQVACQHNVLCVHRTACIHQQACMHRIQCGHPVWTPYGWRPAHPFDTIHPFDYVHPFDTEHPFDLLHPFDYASRTRPSLLPDAPNSSPLWTGTITAEEMFPFFDRG